MGNGNSEKGTPYEAIKRQRMNNPTQHPSAALRIEAWSINCLLHYVSCYAANRNLLTVAESLTAVYAEYLFLLRLVILIHLTRRNAQRITMITDGRGNVITGGNNGGKSHISGLCKSIKLYPKKGIKLNYPKYG